MAKQHSPKTALALAVLAAMSSGTVRGSAEASAADGELEEVVVIASRTRQRILDS